MIVVVTRNVASRFRGFLASCMLEIDSGVYTAPHMTAGVRERVWKTLSEWYNEIGEGSIVITWKDKQAPGGQAIRTLGCSPISLVDCNGIIISYNPYIPKDKELDDDFYSNSIVTFPP